MAVSAAGLIPCATTENPEPCTLCHFIIGFHGLIKYGFTIIIILSIVAIFVAGTMYIISSGDEAMMTKAKGFLKATLYGFAFVFLGWLIVTITMYALSAKSDLGIGITSWNTFTCDTTSTQGQGGIPTGTCGTANNATFDSKPSNNLCSAGTASEVTGSGPWNWTCGGSSCTAWKTGAPRDGACGTAAGKGFFNKPDNGLCSVGTATEVTLSGNEWIWDCGGINGGNKISCKAVKTDKPNPQPGVCGTANGTTRDTAPSAPAELCSAGTATEVTGGTGPWNWKCNGIDGGTTANCSASKTGGTPPPGGNSDLIITSMDFLNCCDNNKTFTASIAIKNQGSGAAGAFTVKGYMSSDTNINLPPTGPPLGDQLACTWPVSNLAAGATENSDMSCKFNGYAVHQNFYIIFKVDADNGVGETNESNNTKNAPFLLSR